MIATSLNSEGFLRTNYRNARSNIKKLRSRGCKVMHGMNATKMANDLLLEGMEFDRIIFNFLHSLENEPHKSQLRRHRELVRQFLANAKKLITEKAEIHIEVVEKKRQLAIPPLNHINSIKPSGKERDRAEENVSKGGVIKERWIKHYSSHQNILLVGEGDFSFSACLALAFGSANNMIATSLNSEWFLKKNYGKAGSNIKKLRSRGGTVMHGVDATTMTNHLLLEGMEFDRIIFNFPHAGFSENESFKSALGRHRKLVRQFLANAKKMIAEKGEIHISHKSNGFFLAWNVELLATQAGLRLIEAVDFNLSDYPGYDTKYGFGGDKNFNCNPSKTYKFGLNKQPKVRSKRL